MPRTFKQVTFTIPPEEYEEALALLPYGKNAETKTFSALVRLGLAKLLPKE